jgi:GntR family transcriptional regulator of arabinose operon
MSEKQIHIRSNILTALNKGELKIGSKLPTENELALQYGISRATIREGIASLVQEGILTRRRGAGTFVQNLTPANGSKIIAAMVPCMRSHKDSFGESIRIIEDKLHDFGYSMILCNHDNDPAKAERYVHRLAQDGVSGVIFSPIQLPDGKEINLKILRRLEAQNLPFVLLGTPVSRDTLSRFSIVSSDGFSGTRQIARHLINLGHRRIAYIRFEGIFSDDERYCGYVEEMHQQGLTIPPEYIKNVKPVAVEDQGQEEVRELLNLAEPPTAVMCLHDLAARNVMEEVQRMGLKVPENLAVTGFGDLYFADRLTPPLTTARLPIEEEADLLLKILFEKIKGDSTGEQQVFLNVDLIVRRSCGAKITEMKIINEASTASLVPK